jgi:hypothetical protein
MTDRQRALLAAVVAARARYGPDYKLRLAENQDWITRARLHGLMLEAWLAPQPQPVSIQGRTFQIAVADELHHIFLMGDYFHTCLSMGDANEMSVLSNAYDANKQVVFMFADEGVGRKQIVARQLLAISSDFRLLGYNCYFSSRWAGQMTYAEVLDAMLAYSRRLAVRCGAELSTDGSPAQINDHFWYDDGPCEWPAAAQSA